ncbi:MAG: lysoplasmalogenase [Nocardioides sp.]
MSGQPLVAGLAAGTALVAVVDWVAVHRGARGVETWAKPATLAGLLLVAVVAGAPGSVAGWWLLVALACGLAGDVLLLEHSSSRFLGGLAAFLLGHLAYLVCFGLVGLDHHGWLWPAALPLLGASWVAARVVPAARRRSGAAMAVPVAAYVVVIGTMLLAGFATGRWAVALGAAVFVVSDSLLALNEFVRPRPDQRLAVMVTYHLGQALIVLGVLAG